MTATTVNNTSRGGVGFLGLLTIVLVILKATGYLNISWLTAFLPVIIPFAIGIIVGLLALMVYAIASAGEAIVNRRRRKRFEKNRLK